MVKYNVWLYWLLGKQVIHPTQVGVVQEAFTPTQDQITWATGLIQEFDKHQKLGKVNFW